MEWLYASLPEVAGSLVGGLIAFAIAYMVSRQERERSGYAHADSFYREIVHAYMRNPQFGDAKLTSDYDRAYSESEAKRYHYFALYVNNFLETLYDLYYQKSDRGIHRQWQHIFNHHARLHKAWLKRHESLFEREYVKYVDAALLAQQSEAENRS